MEDINGQVLETGDIIDMHQTINGENKFVIANLRPLDIRYYCDLERKYEYDKEDLLSPSKLTGEVDFEIIGHIPVFNGR